MDIAAGTGHVIGERSRRAVATFSTGRVDIHPEHVRGSRLPALAWILFSRTWEGWRPIHVYVIEHEQGLMLFDAGQDPASITDPDYYPASRLMRGSHAPLLFVGDVTYDVDAMRMGLIPGIGRHADLLETTRRVLEFERRTGGLAILPAHDRGSAARLTAAGGRSI